MRKFHKQEFDSPRLHHQKPPILGGLIVSRETFWINRGTIAKIDRFHYFAPNQNLIQIDYKFTTNTKTTFYDIIVGFFQNGISRKRSEAIGNDRNPIYPNFEKNIFNVWTKSQNPILSESVRKCPTIYFSCNKFTQKRTSGRITVSEGLRVSTTGDQRLSILPGSGYNVFRFCAPI